MQLKYLFMFFLIAVSSASAGNFYQGANFYDQINTTNVTWLQHPLRNTWQYNNGYLGGEGFQMVFSIDWNKADTNYLYLTTDTIKAWRSDNGGTSWEQIAKDVEPKGGNSIVSDPLNERHVLYMAAVMSSTTTSHNNDEGVYISYDAGKTFSHKLVTKYNKTYHGQLFIWDDTSGNATDSQIAIAGLTNGTAITYDGGDSWSTLNNSFKPLIYALEWPATRRDFFYIASTDGIFKYNLTSNITTELDPLGQLPSDPYDLAVSYNNPNKIYAAVQGGIYLSTDGGDSWTAKTTGLDTGKSYRGISTSNFNANKLIASPTSSGGDRPYYTLDGGNTWSTPTYNTEQFLKVSYYYAKDVVYSPVAESSVFMQPAGTVAKSTDSGATWSYSGDLYTGSRVDDMYFYNSSSWLACLTDKGLYKTYDGGETYQNLNMTQINDKESCGSIDVNSSTIIASSGGWTDKNIIRSLDNGLTWSQITADDETLTYIRFNKNNTNVVYAYRNVSTDGGKTFSGIASGWTILAMNTTNNNIAFGYNGCQVGWTDDNGATFNNFGAAVSCSSNIRDIDIDPFNSSHILIAAGYWALYEWDGSSWVNRDDAEGLPKANNYMFVRFDPNIEGKAWTGRQGTTNHGDIVAVTLDGAKTWTNVINNLGGYSDFYDIRISPYTGMIYLTGSGLYTAYQCQANYTYTAWSSWANYSGCYANNTKIQRRSRIYYDLNNCEDSHNTTIYDYQSIACAGGSYLVTIYPGTTFSPPASNTIYYINNTVLCNGVSMGLYCLNITGGASEGSYCYLDSYVIIPGGNVTQNPINYTPGNGHLFIHIFDEDTGLRINFTEITVKTQKGDYHIENTTTTGYLYHYNLDPGLYTVTLSDTDYYLRHYQATVYNHSTTILRAYLVNSSETVIFTIKDGTTGKEIENATMTITKWINGSLTVLGVFSSDITGRIKFSYNPTTSYFFYVTKSGYADKSFNLNPIIFSTYEVRLYTAQNFLDSSDFSGVTMYINPKIFYEGENNITILFANAQGELTFYGANISYPGGTLTLSGVNSYGELLYSPFNISGSSFGDRVNATVYYKKSGEWIKIHKYSFDVVPLPGSGTLMYNRDNTYGMSLLERGLIATVLVIFTGGGSGLFWRDECRRYNGPIYFWIFGLYWFYS